jgi:spermidine/putrescine ABC transporter ATP-binding subunit
MASEEAIIEIKTVSKHFGAVRAVDDITFNIRRGEFFSLLGPSGCGKTTLLRMLAGFEAPTKGEIYIDGQPMSAVPPHHRPTNMVFQSYAIFPHLTVAQNIAYGLRKKGLTKDEIAGTVEKALEMIQLPGYGGRGAHQLSGGQRQRVALARALVCQPKVLLLDEPLGALDKKLREEMQLELRQLQERLGVTFVFVTHDQEEALTMSDRIAVMSQGKVLQIDSSTRLYEAPNCREVADFIGTMNFIRGRVSSVDNGLATVEIGQIGKLRAPVSNGQFAVNSDVTLAIRPEKIKIDRTQPAASDTNGLQGTVSAEAYLGDRSHFYVDVDGLEKRLAVAAPNMTRSLDETDSRGQKVWATWPVQAGVLLTH